MKPKYTLAVFDFDGTITKKDTLNDLIINEYGFWNFVIRFLEILPFVLLYLLGLIPNEKPKQKLFSRFFSGISESQFDEICRNYSLERINNIVKRECIEKIKWHKEQGHKLIIVSASVEDWIKPWAEVNQIDDVIATQTEVKNAKLTGNFISENCYGKEKVNRFLKKYPYREEYFLYVYGDSSGDKELIRLSDIGFYRRFN